MFDIILVIAMSLIMITATVMGWWYENFGPDEEEKE